MEFNWDEIREKEFPVFKNNINLKAAGGSPMSKSAYDSGLRYFNDMLNQGDIHWDEYFKELNCIREKIANYLNAKPSEIAFLINTSSCMNAIARLIRKGKIIYPEGEFPSSIHAFKRLGFNSTKIKHRGYKYSLEDLERGINKSTTCLIHSHIQYLTGFRQDLEKLGLLCKKSNVISIINATQSFGAFPIDAKQCKINIIVASALKWACCGYGIGILYISEEVMEKFELPFSSWLSVKDPLSMDNDNLQIINKTRYMDCFGGTPHFPALLTLKGGFNLIEEIGNGNLHTGIIRIYKRITELTSEFIDEIGDSNYKIITPLELTYRSGIITLEHKNAAKIFQELVKNKIYISLRNYPKSTEKTFLRFSFNYYNNSSDIKKSVSILKMF